MDTSLTYSISLGSALFVKVNKIFRDRNTLCDPLKYIMNQPTPIALSIRKYTIIQFGLNKVFLFPHSLYYLPIHENLIFVCIDLESSTLPISQCAPDFFQRMKLLFSNFGNSISAMPGGAGILAAGYKGLYKMGGPLSMKDMHGKYLLSKPQKK